MKGCSEVHGHQRMNPTELRSLFLSFDVKRGKDWMTHYMRTFSVFYETCKLTYMETLDLCSLRYLTFTEHQRPLQPHVGINPVGLLVQRLSGFHVERNLLVCRYYPWSSASCPRRAAAASNPPNCVHDSSCFPVSCWTLEINSGLISSECFELISVQLHSSPAAACDSWSCDSESVLLPADGTHSAESQRTDEWRERRRKRSPCSHQKSCILSP